MVVVWVLLAILALVLFLAALLIAALSVPVTLRIATTKMQRAAPRLAGKAPASRKDAAPMANYLRADVVWLFGAVRMDLGERLARRRSAKRRSMARRNRRGDARKSNRSRLATRHLPPGEARELLSLAGPLLKMVGRIARRVRVVGTGELWVGLSDPADTGRLWGQGYVLFTRVSRITGLLIRPAFDGPTLRLDGAVAARTIPITLAYPVLRFLVSRDGRRMMRLIRSSR